MIKSGIQKRDNHLWTSKRGWLSLDFGKDIIIIIFLKDDETFFKVDIILSNEIKLFTCDKNIF